MNSSATRDLQQQILKNMIEQYLVKEDNMLFAQKLFVARTVINWAFAQKTNTNSLEKYLNYVHKYLNNEIDLYWEDGTIHYKAVKKRKE